MRKIGIIKSLIFFIIFSVSSPAVFAQNAVDLDTAIREASVYFIGQVAQNSRIAISNFGASSSDISDYIIDDITKHIVDSGKLLMVDRRYLMEAREELKFNMSEEVSDETAQKIGHLVGAQIVLFGSIKPLRQAYRIQIRAIKVETGEIQGIYTRNIQEEDIERLFPVMPVSPLEFDASFNWGYFLDLGGGSIVGFDMNLLSGQLGAMIEPSRGLPFFLLMDMTLFGVGFTNLADDYGSKIMSIPIRIGGTAEIAIHKFLLGIGGGWVGSFIIGHYSFPYVRGSASLFFADNIGKLGLYVDYNFDMGLKFGIRLGFGMWGSGW